MSIAYRKEEQKLILETENTSYRMTIERNGMLRHTYYGRKAGIGGRYSREGLYDRGFSGNPYEYRIERTVSYDTMLQEYTSCGVGDYRISSMEAENADGSRCADFRYVKHEIRKGKYCIPGLPGVYDNDGEAETLIVTMQDAVTALTVRLYYGLLPETDVITRCAEIINEGEKAVIIHKAGSMCLDLADGEWELIHFYGRHCMERQPERMAVPHGIMKIASSRGMSSHQHNPFVILSRKGTTEDAGECIGIMLMYSGNHMTEIEKDQFEHVRVVTGIDDRAFSWKLMPGESFFTPECILSFSHEGLTKLSHHFHQTIREHVQRGKWAKAVRPVLLNSWEAAYFDVSEESILRLAREAAGIGVDLFVLDDGWFGKRNDDNSSLGDWTVNPDKFPAGLSGVIEPINAMGMKFGIWIEPEMVNEDSELYRSHPDWALKVPGRLPMMGRNQLVLDLSRRDVLEYIYGAIAKLLTDNHIEYVKWDMNRGLSDVYSAKLPADRQGETAHRYVLGVYELLDRLTGEFPEVLFEGCAGGGGRFDAGMLAFTPQIWCSDDTDAIERLDIQYGTSFGYPVSSMGAHVSACPNHQTGRTVPLRTRGIVAMAGTFGYELDPEKLNEADLREIRQQIGDFKRFYNLIQNGLYYRLTGPAGEKDYVSWLFVKKDQTEALLNLVVTRARANEPQIRVRLKGLDPSGIYRMEENDELYPGSALMYEGVVFPLLHGDYQSRQIHFVKEEA